MSEKFAQVAFVNAAGYRLEGEFIADTGPTWLVKPANAPVAVLQKSEWTSVPVSYPNPFSDFDGLVSQFFSSGVFQR